MSIAKLSNAIVGDLKVIPSNCVTNNSSISDGVNTYNLVRGFVGVETDTSNELHVGFNWGNSAGLKSVHVKVTPVTPSKVSIAYQEQPVGFSSLQLDRLVESFLNAMTPKVVAKKKAFIGGKKGGGVYTGPRLEAHKRIKKAPRDQFGLAVNVLFTPNFIATAKKLTITYK
ncbi:MAG: hypothetical protein VKK42_32285 [Lyngbya sp.]|nr:hypothetical protein [Lyngbya sp.]